MTFPRIFGGKFLYMKKITKKEKELVVSALLCMASGDVCVDHFDGETLMKIAKKFNVKKVKNAYIYGSDDYDDPKIVKKIIKNFKIKIDKE